jgi:hypothetical protein
VNPFYFLTILFSLVVCGCESWNNAPVPVTPLPQSSAERAQEKEREHLQGGSLDADRQEAARVNDRLKQVPECSSFITQALQCLNPGAYTNCPLGTTFQLRIEMYQDGSIGNVAVYGWTDAVRTPLFIQDIKLSYLPKWPDAMRSIVGRDYFIMWIDTGSPNPPGPEN